MSPRERSLTGIVAVVLIIAVALMSRNDLFKLPGAIGALAGGVVVALMWIFSERIQRRM